VAKFEKVKFAATPVGGVFVLSKEPLSGTIKAAEAGEVCSNVAPMAPPAIVANMAAQPEKACLGSNPDLVFMATFGLLA